MSMTKKRVSVQIEGRNYALITTDDIKYVNGVAAEVVKHIRDTAQSSKQLDTRDCAVLAALDFCDDRNKALKRNKDFINKADKIIKQTNELNKSCTEYKEKLTEAINENTRLTKRVRILEKQLAELENENDRLNSLLPKLDEKIEEKPSKPIASDCQYSLFNVDGDEQESKEEVAEDVKQSKADAVNERNKSIEKNRSKDRRSKGNA